MSKRRAPARTPLDPEDVLAGRAKPSAIELLDLIHRVNPTGQALGARDAELRYALKSRLQSLLVRRFPEQIEVVPERGRDGVVSLRHRGGAHDGCHAVVAALDEDARAWVQMEIDLGPPAPSAPAAPAPRPSGRGRTPPSPDVGRDGAAPEDLVAHARAAAEAFDYDQARALLEEALAGSGGAAGPAAALLTLLVDTLGDDHGGLAIEAALSREALADPAVRGALAVAAARTGAEERALALARGAAPGLGATAFAGLAAAALGRGEIERGTAHLAEARRLDPRHPGLEALAAEIARARAAARGPAEAELAALVDAERDDQAEQKAREMLARWPESEPARRAQRTLEERRRRREVERLAAEGDAALAAGDAGLSCARLRQALAAVRGPERGDIEKRLRRAEGVERALREAARVADVERRLGAGEAREGLLAYLDLDEALRPRVAPGAFAEVLAWLQLVGRGAPRAQVDAALALAEARRRVDADPEAAAALLGPHAALLDRVPEARRVAREAEARGDGLRAARALGELSAARAAWAAGDAAEALRRLDEATVRALAPGDRAEAAALRAEVERHREVERLGAAALGLRATKRLFEARAAAEEAARAAQGEARARWEAERRAIQDEIQRAFRVEVDETPVPINEGGAPLPRNKDGETPRWLIEDGSAVVLADEQAGWFRVRVANVGGAEARVTVMLRAPESFERAWAEVRGRTLWLIGTRGALLALSLDGWDVLLFRRGREVVPDGAEAVGALLAAYPEEPPHVWLAMGSHARVIDVNGRRAREIPDVVALRPMASMAVVMARRHDELTVSYAPRGTKMGGPIASSEGFVTHPDGARMVALFRARDADGAFSLAWMASLPGDMPDEPQIIAGADGLRPAGMVSAREPHLVVIFFWTRAGAHELLVLGRSGVAQPGNASLRVLYRVPCPPGLLLLQDAASRYAAALEPRTGGTSTWAFGPEPPVLDPPPPGTRLWPKDAFILHACWHPVGAHADLMLRATEMAQGADVDLLTRRLLSLVSPNPHDAGAILAVAHGAQRAGTGTAASAAGRLLQTALLSSPDAPAVRLFRADVQGGEGAWAEVRATLAGLPREGLAADQKRHAYHLEALAALWAGDLEGARAAVDAGLAHPGRCGIAGVGDLAAPVVGWDAELPPVAQVVGAVREADARLAAGDAAGALASLDHPAVWASREVQSLARLAEASLGAPAADRRRRFQRITALAKFLQADGTSFPNRRLEMPIPGAIWDRARLDDLAARAKTWLEEERGGGETS
jgi:hypothetical protein